MKKGIFLTFVVAVASTSAFVISKVQLTGGVDENQLLMENVEALSVAEEKDGDPCYNRIVADDAHMVRYCPICRFIPGDDAWNAISSTCNP